MRKISQMNSRNPKKFEPTPPKFIIGTLVLFFAITGCSDMPYTGSNLTYLDVNRYLVSTDGESVCFQDDLDTTCIKLITATGNPADATNRPAVYIYPERRVHTFYYQGNPILHAERVRIGPARTGDGDPPTPNGNNGNNGNGNGNGNGDGNGDNGDGNGNNGDGNGNDGNGNGNNGDGNGDGNGDNGDGNGNNGDGNGDNGDDNGNNGDGDGNGNNGDDNGNNGDGDGNGNNGDGNGDGNGDNGDDNGNLPDNNGDGHGWLIWIYYPEETAPNNAPTLSESGVTVTINGRQLTDEDITGFAQFIGSDGEKGIQFFYPTESADLLNLRIQIEGVDSNDETVRFNINYLWNAQ